MLANITKHSMDTGLIVLLLVLVVGVEQGSANPDGLGKDAAVHGIGVGQQTVGLDGSWFGGDMSKVVGFVEIGRDWNFSESGVGN